METLTFKPRGNMTDGHAKNRSSIIEEMKFFKIERNIAPPKRGQPPSPIIQESVLNMLACLEEMKKDESIVVRNMSKGTILKYIKKERPDLNGYVRIGTVNKEKCWYRIHRL